MSILFTENVQYTLLVSSFEIESSEISSFPESFEVKFTKLTSSHFNYDTISVNQANHDGPFQFKTIINFQ